MDLNHAMFADDCFPGVEAQCKYYFQKCHGSENAMLSPMYNMNVNKTSVKPSCNIPHSTPHLQYAPIILGALNERN